ncbi:MAG: M48 family metallopeptidase [Coriobacteriia bacterium]|nr:M48 family metallopeptidase [Coriobacteriia bacterium]MCL2746557.1 M48 family metallopeptidase [Coriobacteriia bacterium]
MYPNSYTLIRSKRKTLAIYVRDGEVEVRAPQRASLGQIESFLASKEAWIVRKVAESAQRVKQRDSFRLDYDDAVLYRGRHYPITAHEDEGEGEPVGFDGVHFFVPAGLDSDGIKQTCVQAYHPLAHDYLTNRTLDIARQMNIMPAAIKISNAKRQWGSCNSKGVLRFSWRLIMAGDEVIDYVIVHELAHLLQMNHSPHFWSIVQRELPDYKARQKRLRQLQEQLATQNWDV